MNLLRLQLAASFVQEGMTKIKNGLVHDGVSSVEKGFVLLVALLKDVEAKQREAA